MVWTVWGSNPGRARFSASVQTGPAANPASRTMGTAYLTRREAPLSRAEVKERVELYLHSPLDPHGMFEGEFYLHLCLTE